jgi:hypothetical protein
VLELAETQPSRIEIHFTDDPTSNCFVVQAPDGVVTRISLPEIGAETRL